MISIRDARAEDARGIAKVQVQSWIDTYTGLMPATILECLSVDKSEGRFLEAIESRPEVHVYVAEDEGRVVGFALAGPCRDKDAETMGEVYALYVLQAYQGKGTGSRLFQNAIWDLTGSDFQSLMVRVLVGNPYSRFYESHGGKESEIRFENVGGNMLALHIFKWESMPQAAVQ